MAQIVPRFQAFDSAGAPLSGGKLHTKIAGTSTNKPTYSDPGLTTPNTNPVILDSRGEAAIFGSGTYKFILKTSADVTIWTQDDVVVSVTSALTDADLDTRIQLEESADEDIIRFDIAGTEQLTIQDGKIEPTTDNDIDIGTATKKIKNINMAGTFLDGTSEIIALALPGLVRRPKFSRKDGDEIYIDPGVYHHQGTVEQFVYWDSQLTFQLQAAGSNAASHNYGDDGWHYIYLDDSAIITQAVPLLDDDCFINLTGANTAPVRTVAKHGWYGDGVGDAGLNDRCIFACYETGGAILQWWHDGGDLVRWDTSYEELAATDINITWTDQALTRIPGFCTKALAQFTGHYVDGATTLQVRVNGSSSIGYDVLAIDADVQEAIQITPAFTDSSQVIEVRYSASNGNTLGVETHGWYFPVGM